MVYNPVIIFSPLQGDGMVGKITRRLTGGKIQYPKYYTNSRQETKKIQQLSRKKTPQFDEN